MKYCAKCGIQNEDEVLFCLNCGNKFENSGENNDENNPQVQEPQEQSGQITEQPQFYQPQQPVQQYQPPQPQQQYYQPAPQYQQQPMGYYPQPMPVPGKGMAIASLVLGICSIVYLFFLGIIGIVLAVMAKKKMLAAGYPTGLATAGLVLSIIGTALGAILVVTCLSCIGAAGCAATSAVPW